MSEGASIHCARAGGAAGAGGWDRTTIRCFHSLVANGSFIMICSFMFAGYASFCRLNHETSCLTHHLRWLIQCSAPELAGLLLKSPSVV